MFSSRGSLAKLAQLAFSVYLLVALFYTTNYVIVSPVSRLFYSVLGSRSVDATQVVSGTRSSSLARFDLVAHARQISSARHDSGGQSSPNSLWTFSTSDNLIYWHDSDNENPILEETLLSKAFAQAMHPTRIIPFFYKSTGAVSKDDVTITTLVTSNRYKVLKQLVEQYKGTCLYAFTVAAADNPVGPISVTIHIPLPSEGANTIATRHFVAAIRELDHLYMSSPYFATYVDVHLALSPLSSTSRAESGTTEGGRQFNVWRNVARLFARTDFVMMLDVDFAICTDWRSAIRTAMNDSSHLGVRARDTIGDGSSARGKSGPLNGEVIQDLREGKIALVLAAFEYVKQDDGLDQSTFPRNKEVCRVILALSLFILLFTGSRSIDNWTPA